MGHPQKDEESVGHLAARPHAFWEANFAINPDIAKTSTSTYPTGNLETEDLYQKIARLHAENQSLSLKNDGRERHDTYCGTASADAGSLPTQPMKVPVPRYWSQLPIPHAALQTQCQGEEKAIEVMHPQQPDDQATEAWSRGTLGHPYSCGAACKYARRKGGCREGTQCLNCHQCHWRRTGEKDHLQPLVQQQQNETYATLSATAVAATAAMSAQSVGSIGHPMLCQPACKYVSKNRGCKDGFLCNRCHACQWERKAMQAQPMMAQAFASGRGVSL
eukprot:TRINITY_DN19060_c0_g1_i1.p1 TRINITY_DN19060_c0_g1~~TRINITY_DN19060_c0_g1_i1.p1  ORF type:complete len:276 (-),score=44.09 TRINITY_DN19060_c0_g1_i1:156-983(-)